MHLVKREDWATIDLDVTNGHVFVRQDWFYEWKDPPPGVPAWTEDEKAAYHHAVDHLIWGHWSMRASIIVSPRDARSKAMEPAKRLTHRRLTLSFDVRKVPTRSQWLVRVAKHDPKDDKKVNPKAKGLPRAECSFPNKEIDLYDFGVTPRLAKRVKNDPKALPGFYAVPHEFGHALGYARPKREDGDEYETLDHFDDIHSIMNIGRRVRARHFFMVTATLGRMVPAYTFSASVES